MWAAARRFPGFRNTEKRYQWNLIYSQIISGFMTLTKTLTYIFCQLFLSYITNLHIFTHSLQCTKYCLILSPNWFWINEPCTTWLLQIYVAIQLHIAWSLTNPFEHPCHRKTMNPGVLTSFISCLDPHRLQVAILSSVVWPNHRQCLPEPSWTHLRHRERPGPESGDWAQPCLSLSQLSVMDSPRWPALASLTLAVTGLRRHPGLMPGQCHWCFVSPV